ncbi:hypothetical protein [Streptomyces sp. NPDC058745]|uniref:hypothetical protein n=1 Tax=Streptomyces sp. NPDC058745 TaxID=3346621 RepID=UPI0036B1369B
MEDSLWHAPVDPADVHTAAHAVPPLDDEFDGLLDDLAGVHPGIDLLRDGIRLLAVDRHEANGTQAIAATIAGSGDGTDIVNALALLVQRLTDPATNPCLRALPEPQQKATRHAGEQTASLLADPYLRDRAAEIPAAIQGI